jgi:hypothetical protein
MDLVMSSSALETKEDLETILMTIEKKIKGSVYFFGFGQGRHNDHLLRRSLTPQEYFQAISKVLVCWNWIICKTPLLKFIKS